MRRRTAELLLLIVAVASLCHGGKRELRMQLQLKPELDLEGTESVFVGPILIEPVEANIKLATHSDGLRVWAVGPDGEIYLPIVGRVDVVGRTVDEVTKEITEGYRKEMINP